MSLRKTIFSKYNGCAKPSSITDLSSGTALATAVKLNFTIPYSCENIVMYRVYNNDILNTELFAGGEIWVVGLTPQTTYNNITVTSVDSLDRESEKSNVLSVTTTTTTLDLVGLLAHFKMNEITGKSVIEYINGYHGTWLGNNDTWRNKIGKLGKATEFSSVSTNDTSISVPGLDDKFDGVSFTISTWINTTYSGANSRMIQNRGQGGFSAKIQGGWQMDIGTHYTNWGLVWKDVAWLDFYNFGDTTPCNIRDGNWHLSTLMWDTVTGTASVWENDLKVKEIQNNAMIGANLNPNPNAGFLFGKSNQNQQYYPGFLDDTFIYLKVLTQTQMTNLFNNGNGTTL